MTAPFKKREKSRITGGETVSRKRDFAIRLNKVLTHRTKDEPQRYLACAPAQTKCTGMVSTGSGSAAHYVPFQQNPRQRMQGPETENRVKEGYMSIINNY